MERLGNLSMLVSFWQCWCKMSVSDKRHSAYVTNQPGACVPWLRKYATLSKK